MPALRSAAVFGVFSDMLVSCHAAGQTENPGDLRSRRQPLSMQLLPAPLEVALDRREVVAGGMQIDEQPADDRMFTHADPIKTFQRQQQRIERDACQYLRFRSLLAIVVHSPGGDPPTRLRFPDFGRLRCPPTARPILIAREILGGRLIDLGRRGRAGEFLCHAG